MALDWLAIIKTPAGLMFKKILNVMTARYARYKASGRAIRGEDLASQGSLHHLIKMELEKLAASDKLPEGLQSDEFRNWLRQGDNLELFVEVFIARAGKRPDISKKAEERLAESYERVTQETRKLAPGRVELAVSHVYGQLTATDEGREALQLALGEWTAAQVFGLSRAEQRQPPSHADLKRVKAMAAALLDAGKRSWKMPGFVAPLTLEEHLQQDDSKLQPTDASNLFSAIEIGDSLILFGAGGIGKTTFLLDLCTYSLNEGRRIPLYVEAAVWARSKSSLFEYLTNLPSARANDVTSADLTKLAKAGGLVIMLNGWNEMAVSSKLDCRDGLIHLTATAEALNFVVVSRTSGDVPSVAKAKQVEVRGLTWHGQSAVIRAELGDHRAAPLVDLLAKNTRLRHAARSPLILRGLIAQASKGSVAHSSIFDLLGSAVQSFEEDEQRNLVLFGPPVDGHQRAYLEELACVLTQQLTTNCSRDNALQAIHSAAKRLAERQLIGAFPNLNSVLDVLVSHHLLHLDEGFVRFAHQRFQEYFAATRLLRQCIEEVAPPPLLRAALNQPSWNESIFLVAEKLKDGKGLAAARVRLVKATAEIDLGFACDLAGICALSETDDPALYHYIVSRVNKAAESSLEEVHDLGVAYQIAAGLPAFAEKLWPLLESEDQQVRLHTYRLNGSAISLTQLGAGADQRIASWSPKRRIEFVHEVADNAENFEFIAGLARTEPDPAVRAAAISALFWHFPASDVALQAWLNAPIEVQTEHDVLSNIQFALEEGYAGEEVRERLVTIACKGTSENTQLRLALAFPNEVGPCALDVVFGYLRSSEHNRDDAPLVAIARHNAPERLPDLALELVFKGRVVPEWVGTYFKEAPDEVKTGVFERAWAILQGPDFKNLNLEVIGSLANRDQIERSVAFRLQYGAARGTLTDIERERYRHLESLLTYVNGDALLNVVMRRGQTASYNEAAQLTDLVLRRIGRDDGSARTTNQWLPNVEEIRQLIALFAEKTETEEVPQDTVRVYLCSIASHVAPDEFGPFLLETCHRHLEAWSNYREKVSQLAKKAASRRPHNPQFGLYLMSALARWGPDALPGLIELMAHPSAMEFVPEGIGRIITLPWASKRERLFSSVSTDIKEGEERRSLGRELRQPDDTFQFWTDKAAEVLGQQLSQLLINYLEKKSGGGKWNPREAEYHIGRLTGVVASIPSGGIVEPVRRALASGLLDVYGTIRALRALMRQGMYISDAAVVRQLETLYDEAANAKWHDNSFRYAMSELTELLLSIEPISLLSKPLRQYLEQWRRFSHPNEIIRHLGAMHTEAAWQILLELGRDFAEKGKPPEELIPALVSALTPRHLNEFLALVTDGTLFSWCHNGWTLGRLSPRVAAVLNEAPGQVESFLEACRKVQSPLADALAGGVLSLTMGSEEAYRSFMLEALDAGRAVHPNMPAYSKLRGMFTHKIPITESQYEVTPKANNELRAQLYARAKGKGSIADGCRRLLASLECGRREDGRPDDEPRHPAPEEGVAWTDVLLAEQKVH